MPLSLEDLDLRGWAHTEADQVVFAISGAWAAPGERRIGYVGIMRLVECVRELHWARDVVTAAEGAPVDCITRSLTADFLAPVVIGTRVIGRYRVQLCSRRSYGLEVTLSSGGQRSELVRASMVDVFYDPVHERCVAPPASVAALLRTLTMRNPTVR